MVQNEAVRAKRRFSSICFHLTKCHLGLPVFEQCPLWGWFPSVDGQNLATAGRWFRVLFIPTGQLVRSRCFFHGIFIIDKPSY